MSSDVGDAAMEKFWGTAELAEMPLSFLDAQDTLRLAQSRILNMKILQMPLVWNKLIRRTLPISEQNFFSWKQ